MAHAGRWYRNGDTLRIQGGFLTAYPRVASSGYSGTYTWYWDLFRSNSAGQLLYHASGSLSGASPTLNVQLDYAHHPTYYHLNLIVGYYAPGGTNACTDSASIVIYGDTFPPSPWAQFCRDSILLQIGGRQVQPRRSISLPLGAYPFSLSVTGDFRGWWLTGPSPAQHRHDWRNYPAGTILDTVYLTSPGRHYLRIHFYNGICWDTIPYIIDAYIDSPFQNCLDSTMQPCLPLLIINNASYLPNSSQPIRLANGTYTFHLAPASPIPSTYYPNYIYDWRICGANLPSGCLVGQGSSITLPIISASYILEVYARVNWLCGVTQFCADTFTFVFTGGGLPNDSVIVYYPGDTTVYTPGDTISLPLDTVCLHAGVYTPYPDSVYWWNWTLYGLNGSAVDSGITSTSCVFSTQPGVYTLIYGLTPPPTNRVTQNRQYAFYIHFGARSAVLPKKDMEGSTPILYPNPVSGLAWLSLSTEGPYEVAILDYTGREIERFVLRGKGPHELPLFLQAGFYLMRVTGSGTSHIIRFIVE
ncbi:MAG: T9SS type A sorting domain-containing protein [Bacteroidia bacterium]|nr:T9SS type A sorting domain-containing protein [Bacteroidia bacterium]